MNRIKIDGNRSPFKIDKNIYGHFSEHLGRCIYNGIFVGKNSSIPNKNGMRTDVVEALRAIKIPVLRWPGGCFADEYHWTDGIGALHTRKKMINTHWGGVVEDNSFGTHEFFELCAQLGCEPYITGNVGSGTVREMQEWVEYITFDGDSPMSRLRAANGSPEPWRIRYWGVGNENWGCGGSMTPEYYANEFRRYSTYVRNFAGNRIEKIACGPSDGDYRWTEVVMREAAWMMAGLSLHSYTIPSGQWDRKGSATDFGEDAYFYTLKRTKKMDEYITRHSAVMDRYDPERRVGLLVDEWGIWTDVEPGTNPGFLYQQNSLRDALIASTNFDIFNRHGARVRMANIAQTVNVLQSVILTEGEKMLLTPTFYAYELYNGHHDAAFLPMDIESPVYTYEKDSQDAVSGTASRGADGGIYLTLTNLDANSAQSFEAEIYGTAVKSASARVLTADRVNAYNRYDEAAEVKTIDFDGVSVRDGKLIIELPAKSVVGISIK